MYYYDPNDRKPRRWALLALLLYVVLLTSSFAFVSFDFREIAEKADTIEIEFVEPQPEPEPPKPPVVATTEPRVHEQPAPEERIAQVDGADEQTRTPNPRALFPTNRGGVDEPDNTGNPRAKEGEDSASGNGPGLDVDGLFELDRGLQGRGLVGNMPKPVHPGNQVGTVVVRVTVGPKGDVQSAVFEPKGSTISDPRYIDAARNAALKARFAEKEALVQGGTITYKFNLK